MFGRIAIAAALMVLATSAHAFQQERAGSSTPEKTTPPVAGTVVTPQTELQGTTTTLPKDAGGTVVSIPGLGRLGVIPKLDFGLELLYGANKTPEQSVEEKERVDEGDFRIRGSVKHRF